MSASSLSVSSMSEDPLQFLNDERTLSQLDADPSLNPINGMRIRLTLQEDDYSSLINKVASYTLSIIPKDGLHSLSSNQSGTLTLSCDVRKYSHTKDGYRTDLQYVPKVPPSRSTLILLKEVEGSSAMQTVDFVYEDGGEVDNAVNFKNSQRVVEELSRTLDDLERRLST